MPSLDTTNLILGVIAVAAFAQSLLFLLTALWLRRQFVAVGEALSRLSELDLPALSDRAHKLADDVHDIAAATARAGHEIERTARGAQTVVHVLGREVERATSGVRLSFDAIEWAAGQITAIASGLKVGARELLFGRGRTAPRRIEAGAYGSPAGETPAPTR